MDVSSRLIDQTKQFHSQAMELMELPLGTVTGGLAWAECGFCVLAAGDIPQAGDLFQKGLTVPSAFMLLARPMLLAGSAFVALGRNDVAGAAEIVREAREFAEERSMRHFYPLMSLADAQVSLASGDTAGALESFGRAEELALEMGMLPLAWKARAGAAQVLASMDREEESAAKKSEALSLIHELADLFEDQNLGSMYLEDAIKTLVLSQLGFGNCLRKRLRLLPFFRSVDVGGWQPWDENGMWSGWKGKNETSWND